MSGYRLRLFAIGLIGFGVGFLFNIISLLAGAYRQLADDAEAADSPSR